MYALVVLLNLNVVMASYGSKHKDKGYRSAWEGMTNQNLNKDVSGDNRDDDDDTDDNVGGERDDA
jgi:hypothetical protein